MKPTKQKPAWLLAVALSGAMLASAPAMAKQVTQEEYGAFKRSPTGQAQFDIDFVVDRMQNGLPIARSSVSAFETIAKGGPGQFGAMLSLDEARQAAGLLDRYGQRGVAESLRQSWQIATPSGRGYGEVESTLGTLDNPTGSHTYREGNQMVVKDPPGGLTIRNIARSCFWASGTPSVVDEPKGPYVQKLTLPGSQVWPRLVERRSNSDEQDLIDHYRMEHVIINSEAGEATQNSFRAYAYGRMIRKDRNEKAIDEDGNEYIKHVSYQVNEPPSWRSYRCHPQSVRP